MNDSRQLLRSTLGSLAFMSDCKCGSSVCSKASKKELEKTDPMQTNGGFMNVSSRERKTECMETNLGETEQGRTTNDCNVNPRVAEESYLSCSASDSIVHCTEKNRTSSCQTTNETLSTVTHQTHLELSCSDLDFEVVFIGTGASLPSKYRNVSSTLVSIR